MKKEPEKIVDYEQNNRRRQLMMDAEKARELAFNKEDEKSCSHFLCCCCFPCLPMWTRTLCCFIFLGLCGVISLGVFFVLTFRQPQIVFNGGRYAYQQAASNDIQLEYSIYNGNFFEMSFEKIRAVVNIRTKKKA